jgi:glyoxylase-like metal-dependent hydrolase (beta-lactamase superfamily II)
MAIGDVRAVPDSDDVYYVDTGAYEVPEYGCVYLIDAAEPAVVDTGLGADRERVFAALDEVGIARDDLAHVLPTHVHLDHAGGAGYLADACPNATVRTHERGVRHLVDPARLVAGTKAAVGDQWQYYAEPEPVPEERVAGLTDGDVLDLGDRRLDVVAAPGHAPHQVLFHDDADDLLFTADAAGIRSPSTGDIYPTSPPPQFDLWGCLDDVATIRGRDPERLCFGHFGPVAYDPSLADAYAETLVGWVNEVRRARETLGDDEAVVERFASAPDLSAVEAYGERKASDEARLNANGALAYLDAAADADG